MMRKLGFGLCVLFTGMVMACGAFADRDTFDPTRTWVAMPLPEAPTIDGEIEMDIWQHSVASDPDGGSAWSIGFNLNAEDFVIGGENPTSNVDPPGPIDETDINVEIFSGYTEDNLYVAVRVQDDILNSDTAEAESQNQNTWQDDGAEVFVDGDNSNFAERDTSGENPEIIDTGGQYVVTINNAYREAEAGNPGYGPDQAWHALTQVDEENNVYEAEFRISMDEIGNPEQGDIIGFTVAVNDDDSGGDSLDNQYTWVGETHTEESYGNLVLGPMSYDAPQTTAAPTIDGSIASDEYGDAEVVEVDTYTGLYTTGDNDWPEDDHSFNYRVLHDENNVYIGMEVTDDQIKTDSAEAGSSGGSTWQDDSTEVFIDGDNSDDVLRFTDTEHPEGVFEGQYVLTANGARRTNEANNPPFGEDAQWFAATSQTDGGFVTEYRIAKEGLDIPADANVIGFNANINDDDDSDLWTSEPKTQLNWHGFPHYEVSYGNLVLSDGDTSVNQWSIY